jgi:phospholipase/carboxylesterase
MLECLEKVNYSSGEAEYFVIWLHGLGANNNDFAPLVPELKLNRAVKFIFPNAPMMPITINNGYVMRAWYDIKSFDRIDSQIDNVGIDNTVNQIEHMIDSLVNSGILSTQIILAGFSQGGVISYTAGIKSKHKLGGILALSCYLPNEFTLVQLESKNKNTPFLAIHGTSDHIVPYEIGLSGYNTLKVSGYNIEWLEYPMEHSVCAKEVVDISNWFHKIFN